MLMSRIGSQASVVSINTGSGVFTGNVILSASWTSNANYAGPFSVPFIAGNSTYIRVSGNTGTPTLDGVLLKTDANITSFNSGKLYSYNNSGATGNVGLYNTLTSDSTGNTWAILGANTINAGGIAKLSSNLSVISLTQFVTTSAPVYRISSPSGRSQINIDADNNVYLTGDGGSSSNKVYYTVKLNSAGAVQYYYHIDTGTVTGDLDLEYNSFLTSTNLYIIGRSNDSPRSALLMKFDLNGNLDWASKLSGSGITQYSGICVLNDEIYVTGLTNISGTNTGIVVKYNSVGNPVWQKSYGSIGQIYAIKTFANQLYVIGHTLTSGKFYINLMKLDTTGNVLWSNLLNCTTQTNGITPSLTDAKNAFIIDNNKIKFIFITQNTVKFFMFILPLDGSIPGSGTYTNVGQTFTYATQSMTTSNTSLTSASRSVTMTSPTYTATNIISRITGTVSVPASTYTLGKTYI